MCVQCSSAHCPRILQDSTSQLFGHPHAPPWKSPHSGEGWGWGCSRGLVGPSSVPSQSRIDEMTLIMGLTLLWRDRLLPFCRAYIFLTSYPDWFLRGFKALSKIPKLPKVKLKRSNWCSCQRIAYSHKKESVLIRTSTWMNLENNMLSERS